MGTILNFEDKAKILDRLPGMVFQCIYSQPNFPFIFANEGCEALTGYTPEALLANGLNLMDLVIPSNKEDLQLQIDTTLAYGAPLEASFMILNKKDEEKIILLRAHISKTDDEGMPQIIEGLLIDITKQVRLVATQRDNYNSTDFWAKIGHGVRTPMNAILGLSELGLREDMPKSVREYTQTIKKAGENLMVVMDNMMDYSRLAKGELEIKTDAYNLSSLVSDIAALTKEQMQSTAVEFVVYVNSNIPNILMGDSLRVRQILLNILSNAVKFTDNGYVSLSIDSIEQNDSINLVITVEDTGHGIREEDIGLLFKEFAQFDSKNIDGGGLGLVVANDLVRLMGGGIQVTSIFNVGSIFTITIPQGIPKDCNNENKKEVFKVKNASSISVLVYERRKVCNASMVRTLENLGVQWESVASPNDFYAKLSNNSYTFVFTANALYDEFKLWHPDYKITPTIVLITEYGKTPTITEPVTILTKPIFHLPVIDVLNGVETNSRPYHALDGAIPRFTAPEAHVLIVDDIGANLIVAEGLLQPYKMQLDLCESGAEAIELVKTNRYDMILMDYRMPNMDGVECTNRIRNMSDNHRTDCKSVPIVALTANTEYASRELFRQNGFDDFLPKPIKTVRLNTCIEKWIPASKKEKIINLESSKTLPEHQESNSALQISGVDVKKGIAGTGGNMEIYMRVISKYYENGLKLLEEIKTCLDIDNIKLYLIHVHALNSLSASIGASNIAKAAEVLENAAEEGDIDFIKMKTPDFLYELETLLKAIKPAVTKNSEAPVPDKIQVINKKKRILIVDDTEAYLLILNDILKNDYETIIAMDGEDGLETAKLTQPDLILLDIVMPGLDGYEVLKALRADKDLKSIPVILISGKSSDQNEIKGYTLGADGYIKKPFEKIVIQNKVKSILGGM
ncbi:MAG: response regulator [Defluviitaleaceae bacterium]|nr:response regulator [Defluviitaleaceae bacterium]